MNTEVLIRAQLVSAIETALSGVTVLDFEPIITGEEDITALDLRGDGAVPRYVYVHNTRTVSSSLSKSSPGKNKRAHTHEIRVCRGVEVGNQSASYDGVRADVAAILDQFASMTPAEIFPPAVVLNACRITTAEDLEIEYSIIKVEHLGVLLSGAFSIQTEEALVRA